MISLGSRSLSHEGIRAVVVIWHLAIVARGASEVVEIVTPETARSITGNGTEGPPANDSYLQAYGEVHRLRAAPDKRNDGYPDAPDAAKDAYDTVVHSSFVPDDKYPSLAQADWVPPRPPAPPPVYGPPAFHLPHHHHVESPSSRPPTCSRHPHFSVPYSAPSFGLLPKKLGLKLLLKILLKLVLFKMIVKFIAVICLLLFFPLLKAEGSEDGGGSDGDADDRRRMRQLDMVSTYIWDSIEEKNAIFDEEEEMKDIKEIADETEEENAFAGPERAVRFLEFCVSTVNNAVGYLIGYLKKQRNDNEEDLSFYIWDKFYNMVQGL